MDSRLIQKKALMAANTYKQAAYVAQSMVERTLARLEYVRLVPKRILDLGSGVGLFQQALQARYPDAKIIQLDFSHGLLRSKTVAGAICADAHALPFQAESFDLIVANNVFYEMRYLPMVFSECHRVLAMNGLLMFAEPGPLTLEQWRRACTRENWPNAIYDFMDMHDLGDMLLEAGFSDPVMDSQKLTVPFDCVDDMLQDRCDLGISNARLDRNKGLLTPRRWQRICQHVDMDVTLELIQAQAWRAQDKRFSANDEGEVVVPLSSLRSK